MDSPQTLHDFVLNLLNNPDARAAFQLDPQGALHDAGLSDIDAADVRDVIPLVLDYAPTNAVPGLDSTLTQLTSTVSGSGAAGAIQQLQLVTQQLPASPLPTADVTMAAAGTMAGSANGLFSLGTLSGGGLTGSTGLTTGFSQLHDVTHTLDTGALSGATDTATSVTNTVTGTVDGTVGGTLGGTVSGAAGQLPGMPDLSHPLSTVTGIVDSTTHDVTGQLLGGDLLGGLSGGGLTGGASLGSATTNSVGSALHTDSSTHASTSTSTHASTHLDNPLQHGVVGNLLGSVPLVGDSDTHLLDVSHLF